MVTYKERIEIMISELEDIAKIIPTDRYTYDMDQAIKALRTIEKSIMTLFKLEEYVNMDDVYAEIGNAKVLLSIDENDLIIRIPYISGSGDVEDIIKIVRGK
jgi:hypothetical protein